MPGLRKTAADRSEPSRGMWRIPLVVGLPNRVSEDQGHLKVPPVAAQPMISGGEAIALAWNDRPPGGAKTVAASLAMLDDSDMTEDRSLLVWVVHYEGACIRPFGPSISGSSELSCEPTDWTVVIDAATGSFVQSYN